MNLIKVSVIMGGKSQLFWTTKVVRDIIKGVFRHPPTIVNNKTKFKVRQLKQL